MLPFGKVFLSLLNNFSLWVGHNNLGLQSKFHLSMFLLLLPFLHLKKIEIEIFNLIEKSILYSCAFTTVSCNCIFHVIFESNAIRNKTQFASGIPKYSYIAKHVAASLLHV